MSLRRVKSPVAPKITMTHGSALGSEIGSNWVGFVDKAVFPVGN